MAMRNPPHPGGIVRRQCLEPLGLSVTEAARGLGVTRQALSELVNQRTGLSVEMAIRLSKAFGSIQPGNLARAADGLRPLAGARADAGDPGPSLRGGLTTLAGQAHIRPFHGTSVRSTLRISRSNR
jgi:addiction module HigA family antidote